MNNPSVDIFVDEQPDEALSLPLALSVKNLSVEFHTRKGRLTAVKDVSFDVKRGEVLGIIGESGAGKSIMSSALTGLVDPPGRVTGGEIWLAGKQLDYLSPKTLREARGKQVGVIFQDPLTSLNPLFRIDKQLIETIRAHSNMSVAAARAYAIDLLAQVGISSPERRINSYPHEFSGGMRQRVVIALALCASPQLIVADEPTTALDVSVQAQIISLLKRLCEDNGTSIILITHDMGVIAEVADRVAVMYAGSLVEIGSVKDVVENPLHPYTRGLMDAIPSLINNSAERMNQIPGSMPQLSAIPAGCAFHPRCSAAMDVCRIESPRLIDADGREVACHLYGASDRFVPSYHSDPDSSRKSGEGDWESHESLTRSKPGEGATYLEVRDLTKLYDVSLPWLTRKLSNRCKQYLKATDGVTFDINKGETFGIVGESGSGKSTVARMIAGLLTPTRGEVILDGISMSAESLSITHRSLRQQIQMVFQDPGSSLNPSWTVAKIISEPLRILDSKLSVSIVARRVDELLVLVGLHPSDSNKFPHEFSGGQRQRIAIARALSCNAEFIIYDEPSSALDVSVQAQILNLMKDLQREFSLTYLLISHDLAVVRHLADRIGVMYLGRLVEVSARDQLFAAPRHPYTRMLLDAVPDIRKLGRTHELVQGEIPNPIDPPKGCPFNPRCTYANDRCRIERPAFLDGVACHAVAEGRL